MVDFPRRYVGGRASLLRFDLNNIFNLFSMNPKPLSTGKIVGLVILGVLIILVLWVMATYNSLISLNENAKTAQADIEVQYQRRFELLPNLVNTVKGVADFDLSIITKITDARTRYAGAAAGSNERVAAINQFDSALGRLLVVVENYPQIKAAESFQKLQDSIEGTENRISVARNNYNASVNQLNKKVQFFPSNAIARIFNFAERARFEALAEAATAPKIEFDFKGE